VRAIVAAAEWCAAPINHERLSKVLARPDRIDCPADIIARTLSGKLILDAKGRVRASSEFLRLSGPGVLRPSASDATWLYDEMVATGQTVADAGRRNEAAHVFTSELYDRATAKSAG
jgi:NitT/TauT family transport system ATP-binding protein